MRELISKLLLAIDEAWLDYGAKIIYRNNFSSNDDELERLLFEMESKLEGLDTTQACESGPRMTHARPISCRCCYPLPLATDDQALLGSGSRATYLTMEDHVILRDSCAALERSRALLVRTATRTPATAAPIDGLPTAPAPAIGSALSRLTKDARISHMSP